MDAGQEERAAEHHQPFDVVGVAGLKDARDHVVDGREAGRAVVPRVGEVAVEAPDVGRAQRDAFEIVEGPHVLAPPDHLADEPLQ